VNSQLRRIGGWLYRRAENLIAAMLAAMFGAFLLQIIFRYVLNLPIGWTNEISVVLWLWLVLFGAAFVLREEEEIRFDLYVVSLPATWDYVTFMRVESTAYLKIRFDGLFSIYVVFVVATVIRYLWLSWRALRGEAPEEFDPTKAGSGV